LIHTNRYEPKFRSLGEEIAQIRKQHVYSLKHWEKPTVYIDNLEKLSVARTFP
jgi:hypothetical protein